MVSFNAVPTDLLVPFVAIEIDGSQASQGPGLQPYTGLVLGQRLAAGTVPQLEPTLITSAEQAGDAFGRGSQLHGMALRLFQNARLTAFWFVGLDDPAGASAQGSLAFTGAATAGGTVYLYVAGRRLQVGVLETETAATIAAAVADEINADDSLPVTALAVAGTVSVTSRHAGVIGNDIDLRVNYYQGERLPEGVGLTVTAVGAATAGTGAPDVAQVWPILGDTHYNVWAVGDSSAANLTALHTELASRWGPLDQREGVACLGARGDFASLITLGDGQNSRHLSIMGAHDSPTPPWEWAAAVAGVVAEHGKVDPARPFQTLPLVGVLPPESTERFDLQERDLLLRDGIATYTVDASGVVRVNRLVTTEQETPSGAPTTAFRDVNTLLTLSYLRWSARTTILGRYARHKLANDGTTFGAGQKVVTPNLMRAELLNLFRAWEELGLVEGFEQFQEMLVVQRSSTDPNRLDVLMPPDLVNQFRVAGIQIQFLL